jgi:carboxymethylenebutenolidase
VILTTDSVDLRVDGRALRTLVVAPKSATRRPGILFYSDIFQLTGPMVRACQRLAGHGFVVAAPEIYHRLEAAGTSIPFDDAGRTRGLENAARTTVAEFDADARSVLDFLATHPDVAPGQLGVGGFCIGGHLAFRAAFQPDVRATVCFYPTGLQDGKLGQDADAGSLSRAGEIRGDLLLVFGTRDPHVPEPAREKIVAALRQAGTRFELALHDAEHAFMRDEGPRYDPEATDRAFEQMLDCYRRTFGAASGGRARPGRAAT